MAYANREAITVTTDGSGDATAYVGPIHGPILAIVYIKDDYAAGVDLAITAETTLQGVWTESNVDASATVAPRQPTHDAVGAASLYAGAGEPVEDYIWLANERLKIVVASGGATKSGTFHVIVGGDIQ